MNWISVKDQLPEEDECILGCEKDGNIDIFFRHKDVYVIPHDYVGSYKITHWMPLPKPPKTK